MNVTDKELDKIKIRKLKKSEYDKKYRSEHPEIMAAWKSRNKEKIAAKQTEYYNTHREQIKKWRDANRETINEKARLWDNSNKDKKKKYQELNRDSINHTKKLYLRKKRATNELYNLKMCLRRSIFYALTKRSLSKAMQSEKIIGCSYAFLKDYIESKFEPWMDWSNRGKYNGELNYGWDIDHIMPLSSAKNEKELMALFHYTNLQPLCSYTNRHIKRDKIDFNETT